MRITKYDTELDDRNLTVLVKEDDVNYPEVDSLNQPIKIVKMLNFMFNAEKKAEEHVWLMALDTKNKLIGIFELSHGTVNCSLTGIREIFVKLCLCGATNFVISHNHPSGDSMASKSDLEITEKIKEVGNLMGIELLDHIIIGRNNYFSFREKGML